MASFMTNKAISLLIFISILQGAQSASVEHKTEVNATVGQNISLPCILSKEGARIVQLEWHKEGEQGQQKLVLFNPAFPVVLHVNVTLEQVYKKNPMELRGLILHLHNVTEKDSGDYVCEIASFPDGNMKSFTKVQLIEPKVTMKITSPGDTVIEGDTVSITCFSDPPADKFTLSSLQSQSIMESPDGKFTVQNISRHFSDPICQPHWSLSTEHLQSLKATVHLSIDYLDNIECNSESQIQVETGTNLTITCAAKSSTSLSFIWMKDNLTVSSSGSINLWSVSPAHSGIYTLIVHSGNHNLTHNRLHKEKGFTVTVMNTTPTEHLSSTMTMETTHQISSTALTTLEPSVTMPTTQLRHTNSSAEEVLYISTSAPSTGNVTVVHANITTTYTGVNSSATTFKHNSIEGRTWSKICCTSSAGSTSRENNYTSTVTFTSAFISTATWTISNVSRNTSIVKAINNATDLHVVFVVIPVLLVLVLIGFLYRQYHIQKRLDMPPPFKPPPPPVKYTSARYDNIPITDIYV